MMSGGTGSLVAVFALAGGLSDAEEAARIVARKAFVAWADGETSAALVEFSNLIERYSRTHWATLAIYIKGRMAAKDLRDERAALRAFRVAANRDPGSPESIAAQVTLGLAYEETGEFAQAFKEYAQIANLDLKPSSRSYGSRWAGKQLPVPRNPFDDAALLVRFAAERCAVLSTFLGPQPGLPPSVIVLRKDTTAEFPPRRREPFWAKTAPEVTFLVAGKGNLIAELDLVVVARVRSSGGVRDRRHWMLSALPEDAREKEAIVLTGRSTAWQRKTATVRPRRPCRRIRLSLSGEAAEFRAWAAKLVRTASARAAPWRKSRSVDEVALAAADGGFVAVWSDPGSREDAIPLLDADLFQSRSRDGLSWGLPERLEVSGGMGERQPSLVKTKKGLWHLAWTSSIRGWGYSDLCLSSSRDGRRWKKPRRLHLPPELLKSFSSKYHVTFRAPVLQEFGDGLKLTFLATGSTLDVKSSGAREWRVCASGVFSMRSENGLIWSKPVLVFSSREHRLSTFRPAPQLPRGQTEEIIGTSRPYGVVLPGRLSARVWVTTCGRLMLTAAARGGKVTKCLVGSGVNCAKLLPGAKGAVLLYSLDSGEVYCTRARDGISYRNPKKLNLGGPVAQFDALMVGADRILVAWPESPGLRNSRLLSRLLPLPPPKYPRGGMKVP